MIDLGPGPLRVGRYLTISADQVSRPVATAGPPALRPLTKPSGQLIPEGFYHGALKVSSVITAFFRFQHVLPIAKCLLEFVWGV